MPRLDPIGLFRNERELIAHIAINLHLLERGLTLYQQDGRLGIEYNLFATVRGRGPSIDVLAVDRNGGFVVIECKLLRGHPAALGQLAGYVAWVRENLATEGQQVRAFLVCMNTSHLLWHAMKEHYRITFYVYQYESRRKIHRTFGHPDPLAPRRLCT